MTDSPFGLKPLDSLDGTTIKGNAYYFKSDYAVAMFVGDPVIVNGTANLAAVNNGQYGAGTLQEVVLATAGATNKVTGVIIGFDFISGNAKIGSNSYKPASTEAVVIVCDDPNALYLIQADATADVAATDMSTNANIILTQDGDTTTGLSGAELATTSMTGDATYQLQILRLYNLIEGNDLGTNPNLIVRLNIPSYAPGVAGV